MIYFFLCFLIFLNYFIFTDNNRQNLGSSYVYKNVQVRLTRLHNRILKDALYKNSVTSNAKSQDQQNKELVVDNMTKEKLMEQAKQEVLYEEMDWEPMNDEDIAQEVLSV